GFRWAPYAKTTLLSSTKAAQPPAGKAPAPSAALPPAASMPPLAERHAPRDAAASNGLGFEPWTAELIPADKRYTWKGVLAPLFALTASLPHPNKTLTMIEPVHNSFAHLRLRNRILLKLLFFENLSQCFQRQI